MSEIELAKCQNGHQYDPSEHDECPYCPKTVGGEVESRKRAVTPVAASPPATMVEGGQDSSAEARGGAPPAADGHTVMESEAAGRETAGTVVGSPPAGAARRADRAAPGTEADTVRGSRGGGGGAPYETRVVGVDDVKLMPIFAWLVVLEGAQQYVDFRIAQEQVYLGGATECDIVIEDDFISGEHASIRCREGKFFITDLDSRNGTFVNDFTPDARIDRVELKDGDNIRIGQVVLKFKCL